MARSDTKRAKALEVMNAMPLRKYIDLRQLAWKAGLTVLEMAAFLREWKHDGHMRMRDRTYSVRGCHVTIHEWKRLQELNSVA
jgi:hypothetical protein